MLRETLDYVTLFNNYSNKEAIGDAREYELYFYTSVQPHDGLPCDA